MKSRLFKFLQINQKPKSLSDLFLFFTTSAFLIVSTILICLVIRSYEFYLNTKKLEIDSTISKLEVSFSETITYSESVVNYIGKQIMVSDGSSQEIARILELFAKSNHRDNDLIRDVLSISMFSWVNKEQYLVASSEMGLIKNPVNIRRLNRDYIQSTIDDPGRIYSGVPVIGAASKQKIIPSGFGVVRARDKKYIGTIVFGFTVEGMRKKSEKMIDFLGMDFVILDKNNKIIFGSENDVENTQVNDIPAFGLAKDKSIIISDFSLFDVDKKLLFIKDLKNYPYRVLVGYKNHVIFDGMIKFFTPYLLGSLITMALFFIVWLMLKLRVINPILELSQASKLIAQDRDDEAKFPQTKVSEIDNLAKQIFTIGNYKFDLLQTKKSQERFFANMNHELRTPLNGILNFSLMIKNGMFGPISEEYKEMAEDINSSGHHLLNLINDILDFAKMDLGKVKIFEEEFELVREVSEATKIVASDILLNRNSPVKITSSIEPTISKIRADRRMFKQILLNLLSNAMKFTNEGEVNLHIFKNRDGGLTLEVHDSGIGIKEEDLKKLAVEFGQVGDGLSRGNKQGSGLGLFLVKKMVGLHNGSFKITSVYGKGTTITIKFPKSRVIS